MDQGIDGWLRDLGVRRSRGHRWGLYVCLLSTYFAVALIGSSVAKACQNETHRVEQGSTALSDCRAFEMVTPPQKESDEPKAVIAGLYASSLASGEGMYVSETGDRMAWTSEYVFPGVEAPGLNYLSTREEGRGWSSEGVIPPQSVENGTDCPGIVAMAAYSSDLSKGVLADGFGQLGSFFGEELQCGHDQPLLVADEPQGFQNLFLRANESRTYELVNVTPSNAPAPHPAAQNNFQYFPAAYLGGSNDLSHVVFEEELPLTSNAGEGDELYLWSNGSVYLITLLADGTSVHGNLAGATKNAALERSTGEFLPRNIAAYNHAVSTDGSRIFFEAEGSLYVRENGDRPESPQLGGECSIPADACTVQVDMQQGGPGAGGGGKFMVASEDGSKVFFTDESRLTLGSNAEPGKPDLYEYDLSQASGQRLMDLTPGGAEPADVLGVSGASGDGSYIYLVADGSLTAGQLNGSGEAAQPGEPNLYLIHEGVTTFIATLDATNDTCEWASRECIDPPLLGGLTARVSRNGLYVGFESDLSLTGYDNNGQTCVPELQSGQGSQVVGYGPGACQEVFLYEAATNTLNCVSCDPGGAPPTRPALIRFPGAASQDAEMRNSYPERNVSDAGQVFFESPDPLVPLALDGKRLENTGKLNVYEYEHAKLHLISGGNGTADSYFLDASVDGSNVFIATAQPLLARDSDSVYDIYDARVNGGLPEPPPATAPCEEESRCRGSIGIPVFSTPLSATFNGAGNLPSSAGKSSVKKKSKPVKCKKGRVKKKGKCVKKRTRKAKSTAKGRK